MIVTDYQINKLKKSIIDSSFVKGYTHDFYNYPARFSPKFVHEVIRQFTEPGDLIIDPFMGGGTTMVEAGILNRNAIGFDISSLATFIAKVKTTPLNDLEIDYIKTWFSKTITSLNCHKLVERPKEWIDNGYHRNFSDKKTWPIRKLIEQFISEVCKLSASENINNFLRCIILKTGQWALDSRENIPSSVTFRSKLTENIHYMCKGLISYRNSINNPKYSNYLIIKNESATKLSISDFNIFQRKPKLVLTSPPYPGIHVIYHRWQIHGKKETPAPFWIANSLDGHGLSYYTLGNRQQKGLKTYYDNIYKTFNSVSKICDSDTLIVQVLAFSEPNWQLTKYLEIMSAVGFKELVIKNNRIWRDVPNRKWYAQKKGKTPSSSEVILFHRLA